MELFKKDQKYKKQKQDMSFMERARDLQDRLEARRNRFGKGKYGRVLKMARKPTDEEYDKTSKITFVGIILIGGLGFTIWLLSTIVLPEVGRMIGILPPLP